MKHFTVKFQIIKKKLKFLQDKSLESSDILVPPEFRIDIDKIHHLISACDVKEISQICGEKIDSLLVGRDICSGHASREMEHVSKALGLDWFMEGNSCRGSKEVATYPERGTIVKNLSTDRNWLQQYFPGGKFNFTKTKIWILLFIL